MAARLGVFINCPFDGEYKAKFQAIVFAVLTCGFKARCALEIDDATESRIAKIERIIGESRFGIHDISRTQLDVTSNLPRFNMPLELGIFLGAKKFGDDEQKKKQCMICDVEQYRFQRFISDLAGMDIKAHDNDPVRLVSHVRDFLVSASRRKTLPSTELLLSSYVEFARTLHLLAADSGLDSDNIVFADFERLVLAWHRLSLMEN